MSRRQEIKEKEALQARFQHAITQNSKLALKWLNTSASSTTTKPATTVNAPSSTSTTTEANSFFDLPVVAQGASLSELSLAKSGRTVGQFVKGQTPTKPHAVTKPRRSKAMQALSNKMRDDKRSQATSRVAKPQSGPRKPVSAPGTGGADSESDSDSDVEAKRKITAKKVVSKRPF